jgi:hypothetical protein
MWIALFAIFLVSVVYLRATAILSYLRCNDLPPHRTNRSSALAEFALGCQDLSRTACGSFEPTGFAATNASQPVPPRNTADTRLLGRSVFRLRHAPVRHFRTQPCSDIGLLLRRMALLNIEPDRVDGIDPLLFRELQGRCTLCQSKESCACDLVRDATGVGYRDWTKYCANAATLSLLSGIQTVKVNHEMMAPN